MKDGGSDSGLLDFLRYLVRIQPRRLFRATAVSVLVALAEAVGLLLLVPLLDAVGIGSGAHREALLPVLDPVGVDLGVILTLYALILCLLAFFALLQTRLLMALQYRVMMDLQRETFDAMLKSGWAFHLQRKPAELVAALTHDIQRIGLGTYHLCTAVASLAILAVYLGFAVWLSPAGALLVVVCGLATSLLLRSRARDAQLSGHRLTEANRALLRELQEQSAGLKTIKGYGLEDRHSALFGERTEALRATFDQTVAHQTAARLWFSVGGAVVLCAALYLLAGPLQRPTVEVVALIAVFGRLLPRMGALQQSYQHLRLLAPSFWALDRLRGDYEASAEHTDAGAPPLRLRHAIDLNGVSFSYRQGQPIVEDVSLEIRAGETTVLVGPSGAGKTTLADLVLGLLLPSQGSIRIDGVPLMAGNAALWRRRVGYLSQDVFLFHDTIRNNLRWSSPVADDDDLWRALRDAAADAFVRALPEGLDTRVGDRGVRLSGGQRQRLALARALLRNPDLLILDEATSWLDSEHERLVREALRHPRGRHAILTITHRMEAARDADRVYVVDHGKLVESGDWGSLTEKRRGRFHALLNAGSG